MTKLLAAIVIAVSTVHYAAAGTDGNNAPSDAVKTFQAREAGARYGQALGALEICYGSKMTSKAKALESAFSGAELENFKTRAAKTYEAWLKVKNCQKQLDPNQCKIIMDKSCLAAEAEIGADGKVMPGLVEFLKH